VVERKKRIPHWITEGPPAIAPEKVVWGSVTKAYKRPVPDKVRHEICEATDNYVKHAAGRATSAPLSAAMKHLTRISNTASKLRQLLISGEGEPVSRAREHANESIRLLLTDAQLPNTNNLNIVREHAVCPKAKDQLEHRAVRDPEKMAWQFWIRRLTFLLEHYGFSTTVSMDVGKTNPSAFVVLVRELQKVIPLKYRKHTHSQNTPDDSALSSAIYRAQSDIPGHQRRRK